LRKYYIGNGDDVLAAIWAAAFGRQSAPIIAIVVELHHRDWLADYKRISGNSEIILERLPKGPELFVLAVSIDRNLRDQLIQRGLNAGARLKCRICVPHDAFLTILSTTTGLGWIERDAGPAAEPVYSIGVY
jgi:hypothetical protein